MRIFLNVFLGALIFFKPVLSKFNSIRDFLHFCCMKFRKSLNLEVMLKTIRRIYMRKHVH